MILKTNSVLPRPRTSTITSRQRNGYGRRRWTCHRSMMTQDGQPATDWLTIVWGTGKGNRRRTVSCSARMTPNMNANTISVSDVAATLPRSTRKTPHPNISGNYSHPAFKSNHERQSPWPNKNWTYSSIWNGTVQHSLRTLNTSPLRSHRSSGHASSPDTRNSRSSAPSPSSPRTSGSSASNSVGITNSVSLSCLFFIRTMERYAIWNGWDLSTRSNVNVPNGHPLNKLSRSNSTFLGDQTNSLCRSGIFHIISITSGKLRTFWKKALEKGLFPDWL